MSKGKCPSCSKKLLRVNAEKIEIKDGAQKLPGISYVCPNCSTVISVQFDPLFLHKVSKS